MQSIHNFKFSVYALKLRIVSYLCCRKSDFFTAFSITFLEPIASSDSTSLFLFFLFLFFFLREVTSTMEVELRQLSISFLVFNSSGSDMSIEASHSSLVIHQSQMQHRIHCKLIVLMLVLTSTDQVWQHICHDKAKVRKHMIKTKYKQQHFFKNVQMR